MGNQLINLLKEGNSRFINNQRKEHNLKHQLQAAMVEQRPYAIVVTCSDSRIPPEIIFDEGIGQLFVVRIAGNILDKIAIGTIEFAIQNFQTKLIAILGHSDCGAVKTSFNKAEKSFFINSIQQSIQPAIDTANLKTFQTTEEKLNFAIIENIQNQKQMLLQSSELIRNYINNEQLQLATGFLQTDTGKVHFF